MSYGQTSYSVDPAIATGGMMADLGPNDIESAINNPSGTAIGFGLFVRTRSDGTDEIPGDDTGFLHGVVTRQDLIMAQYPFNVAAPAAPINPGQSFPVVRKGRVWVYVSTVYSAPTVGSVVRVVNDATHVSDSGKVTGAAAVSNEIRDLGGRAICRALATDPAGLAIALVDLSLP